jgi:hypothetical protein
MGTYAVLEPDGEVVHVAERVGDRVDDRVRENVSRDRVELFVAGFVLERVGACVAVNVPDVVLSVVGDRVGERTVTEP